MKVRDGYSRGKNPRMISVRPMTLEEVKALSGHAKVIANDGSLRDVKINGAVKTWKTNPDRVEVPVKYGMYEYARFETAEALRRFVVVQSQEEIEAEEKALQDVTVTAHDRHFESFRDGEQEKW